MSMMLIYISFSRDNFFYVWIAASPLHDTVKKADKFEDSAAAGCSDSRGTNDRHKLI